MYVVGKQSSNVSQLGGTSIVGCYYHARRISRLCSKVFFLIVGRSSEDFLWGARVDWLTRAYWLLCWSWEWFVDNGTIACKFDGD
jgi:hypothetical protein